MSNVSLYPEAINELCESQGWGIEVTGGHIGSVAVTIPWNALMTRDSHIEVSELSMTIRPRARQTDGTSMLESMWSSVSSSMQLAQECLEKEGGEIDAETAQNAAIEGLEKFAQTIDNVLNRIKANLVNTTIRLEFILPKSERGIAIIITIKRIEYKNEAGADPPQTSPTKEEEAKNDPTDSQKTHLLSSYATHNIRLEGIVFYTEEFRIEKPTDKRDTGTSSAQFYSTISQLPETEQFISSRKSYDESDSESDTDSKTESEKPDPNAKIHTTKAIQICRMEGVQELRLKMKQSENIQGAKVHLDLSFGTLRLFLTPRQIHLITTFCEAFGSGSNKKDTRLDKTIRSSKRLREIRRSSSLGLSNTMTGAIVTNDSWSCADDDFRQFQTSTQSSDYKEHSKSFDIPESLDSSMTSSSSTTNSSKVRKRGTNVNISGDISHYTLYMTSVSIMLLHEDILVECSVGMDSPLSEESVSKLLTLSTTYFENNSTDKSAKEDLISKSHLKLELSPIIMDGEEQRSNNVQLLKFNMSIPQVDILEVLESVETPIILFARNEKDKMGDVKKRPNVHLSFKQITPTLRRTANKRKPPTKTDVVLSLEPCGIELDISLYDRLNSLLNTAPFSMTPMRSKSDASKSSEPSSLEFNVDSSSIDVRLRFPINDSRPLHDENRIPWWKKNIRDEFLLFEMQRFRMQYTFPSVLEVVANEINIFFCENMNANKIHIGRTTLMEKRGPRSSDSSTMDYPKLRLEFPSEKSLRNITKRMLEDGSDSGETSGDSYAGTLYTSKRHERSPFSSKRVCRESGTPHHRENSDNSETFLLPGDSEEMRRFRDTTMQTSKVQIQLFFPSANIQMNSKHLYEVIYNLLNTDLLMWKPSAPTFQADPPATFSSTMDSFMNAGMMDSIYIPRSKCDSDAESASTSSGGEGFDSDQESDMYYSTYDRKYTSSSRRTLSTVPTLTTNSCSFELNINEGVLTLLAPVRGADNKVIPGQRGEFVITLSNLTLFTVSGYQENKNLSYVCLQASEAELFHCGLVPTPDLSPPLRLCGDALPDYLKSTLYPSPHDVTLRGGRGSVDREMLSLAIQVKVVPEQRVKRISVTVGLQNTTLRHHPTISQHTWLNQIIDMIDVLDYPIEGYIPYGVVTEMQLHLWDCSIDYRPLHFPYRAILDLGYFMISSNLTTSLPGCTLRFIAEECALCLAPYDPEGECDIVSNEFLVSVVDLGLLEISLRINEKNTSLFPKLDLRAFIQGVHIRTCSDSGQVLAQLIGYFAADSDLNTTASEFDDSSHLSDRDEGAELLPMKKPSPSVPVVTPKQQERVNTLLSEAMQESIRIVSDSSEDEGAFNTGVEVFFFPDEAQKAKAEALKKEEKRAIDVGEEMLEETPKPDSFNETMAKREEPALTDRLLPGPAQFTQSYYNQRRDSECSDEMRDILNFETSIMAASYMKEDESVEAVPQVTEELGQITIAPPPAPSCFTKRMSSDTDEEYCMIAEEEKAAFTNCGVSKLKIDGDPIRIVDNHFSIPIGKPDLLRAPPNFPMAVSRYTLCEMSVTWHLHGGHDFPKKDENQSDEDKLNDYSSPGMSKVYTSGVSYTKGQPGVTFNKKPMAKLSWKTRGGPWRKHDVLVEIQVNKVRISHEVYPPHTLQASRQVLLITELEILDKLQSSDFHKFLYHPSTNNLPKTSSQHMVVIKALHVRPNPILPAQECCLRISLLPLRLNIDQDTLLFLVDFFTELSVTDDEGQTRKKSVVPHQPPVMLVEDLPEAVQDLQARKMVSENLMLLTEEEKEKEEKEPHQVPEESNDFPIYFKEIIFSPEVIIRLDYHGRRIELSRGPIAGLVMGLGQLQCSEFRLKKIYHREGILGVDRLLSFLCLEWLTDIKTRQIPSILGGIGPMNSVIKFFQGIFDLVRLPIEQYQKDGRIIRGLQLGAQSFTARTAMAALELTARIIQFIQFTAETAYDMVSPGPTVKRYRQSQKKTKRKRMHRPQDIREGVANALQIVREGIGETAQTLRDVTIEEHDQKGYTGAVGAVVRQIPPIVFCPIVLATQATTNILDGVHNQLVPEARMEAREKWKEDDQ